MKDDTPTQSTPDRPEVRPPSPVENGIQVVEIRKGEEVTFAVKVQVLREPPDATTAKLEEITTEVAAIYARAVAIDEQQRDLRTQGEALQACQTRIEGQLRTTEHNLEQARRLLDSLARQQGQLLPEWTDRHILQPLLLRLVDFMGHNGDLPELKRLLDEEDAVVVLPEAGEHFDPHRHEPIQVVPTEDPALDRRILRTFTAGLVHRNRCVRRARVEVYRHNQTTTEIS